MHDALPRLNAAALIPFTHTVAFPHCHGESCNTPVFFFPADVPSLLACLCNSYCKQRFFMLVELKSACRSTTQREGVGVLVLVTDSKAVPCRSLLRGRSAMRAFSKRLERPTDGDIVNADTTASAARRRMKHLCVCTASKAPLRLAAALLAPAASEHTTT